jgi:hypothetical protein
MEQGYCLLKLFILELMSFDYYPVRIKKTTLNIRTYEQVVFLCLSEYDVL